MRVQEREEEINQKKSDKREREEENKMGKMTLLLYAEINSSKAIVRIAEIMKSERYKLRGER